LNGLTHWLAAPQLPSATFWERHRLCYLGRVSEVRLLQDQLLAMLRDQLVAIASGAVFLFIGLASCCLAAVRRRGEARIFVWLGIWSALWGARLLAESAAVVAALSQCVQNSVPLLRIAASYLLLPVALLASWN
jgi:hypothetical protein